MLKGVTASQGYAIGTVLKLDQQVIDSSRKKVYSIANEIKALHRAIKKTVQQIKKLQTLSQDKFDSETSSIFDAHMMIAQDPEMIKLVEDKIAGEHCNLVFAIREVMNQVTDGFKDFEDDYMRQRVSDLLEVSDKIIKNHLGIKQINLSKIKDKVILVAHEFSASDTAMINPDMVLGMISEVGGKNAHSAIIARMLGIPALVGVNQALTKLKDDDKIILDASGGKVLRKFDVEIEKEYEHKITDFILERHKLESLIDVEPMTADHRFIELNVNIGSYQDALQAKKINPYGIGLYRTEILFFDRFELPGEEEQFKEYKRVLEEYDPLPVTIRTLDIGGDKPLPYVKHQKEANPALGDRGIRFSLLHLDVFRTQIKALLRASAFGHLKMMLPMVSTQHEFLTLKASILEIHQELVELKIPVGTYELGVMIEVPSAVMIADELGAVVDFFSIGTNDLIQYTFAADRLNANLEYLNQPFHPSILRLIHMVTEAAKKHQIKTAVCGEMASDPKAALLLIGLGVDELSMSSPALLAVKDQLLKYNYSDLKQLSALCLKCSSETEVIEQINHFMETQLAD